MNNFDPTKPVQTRDGRKAQIIATDINRKDYPIVARVEQPHGGELPVSYTSCGYFYNHTADQPYNSDLINTPEKVKVKFWVNVYEDRTGIQVHDTKEAANDSAEMVTARKRIACICIEKEVTEGEGL